MRLTKETFSEMQPFFVYAKSGRFRVAIYQGEKIVTSEEPSEESGELRTVRRTVYVYLIGWIKPASGRIENEEQAIAAIKEAITAEIIQYDSSPAVNSFILQGRTMWLDKATRTGLMMRLDAEEQAGSTDTTLWYGGQSYTLPLADARRMLMQVELYASQCYDRTQAHLAAVAQMDSVEEILGYDYTAGYPEQLSFE